MTLKETMAVVWLLVVLLVSEASSKCAVREPPDTHVAPKKDDMGFYLTISGDPTTYNPGQIYTVSLKGDKTQFEQKQFSEFLLVVENADEHNIQDGRKTGTFQLLGDVLTRFSDHCTNTVTQTTGVPKSEVQVLWTAPVAGSGCVEFKATVVEEKDIWAMDVGRLAFKLCEEKVEEHNKQDNIVEPCCACEEAKYEVTFEGLWSERTHQKDFPKSEWLLHFSDLIGASHSSDYRVWEYGGYASKGLEQVAKWGSTRVLESELKAESEHIRTIIKARGLWYPNVNGKTFAVFRTDRSNHLVSLVSMLGPSPDWIVGVSGLELCQRNCSWLQNKELFLYPWDVGVDNGITYESGDDPTEPPQPITRITSRHPDDPRQPFWNQAGIPMKPLAKLTITRQRLYRKSCGEEDIPFQDDFSVNTFLDEDGDESDRFGCQVTEWSEWTQCSVTCGKGISMRTREFQLPGKAVMMGCDVQLIQKEMCTAKVPTCQGDHSFYAFAPTGFLPDDMCATTEWSRWSPCSTSCGKGFISRTRSFYNRMGRKKCPHIETMEKAVCEGKLKTCPKLDPAEQTDPACAVTPWSEWSPCSVSCGQGLKVRTRLYLTPPQQQVDVDCNVQLMEKENCAGPREQCEFSTQDAQFICGLKKEVGPCRGFFSRWYFDPALGICEHFNYGGCRGNSNNFERYSDCMKLCENKQNEFPGLGNEEEDDDEEEEELDGIDFALEKKFMMQKQAMMEKQQMIEKQRMMLGTTPIDKDITEEEQIMSAEKQQMLEEQKQLMMAEQKRHMLAQQQAKAMMMEKQKMAAAKDTDVVLLEDCIVTAWSPWSECSASCGRAFRRKFRMIKREAKGGGKRCPRKLERKQKCRLSPCPESCTPSVWGPWEECSKSCGVEGQQERRRVGESCGEPVEKRLCILAKCPEE